MDAALATKSADNLAGQLLVHVETHVSELEADVGVKLVGGDSVENLMIELGTVAGFVGIGDIFAEIVDADAHAGAVDGLGGADGVGNLSAGDEAIGDAAAERRTLGKVA